MSETALMDYIGTLTPDRHGDLPINLAAMAEHAGTSLHELLHHYGLTLEDLDALAQTACDAAYDETGFTPNVFDYATVLDHLAAMRDLDQVTGAGCVARWLDLMAVPLAFPADAALAVLAGLPGEPDGVRETALVFAHEGMTPAAALLAARVV